MSNEQANLNDSQGEQPVESIEPTPSVDATQSLVSAQEGESEGESNALAAPQTIEIGDAKRALEAVLMAASEPMAVNELKRIFDGELSGDTVRNILEELRNDWNERDRSVELALVASGYRFRIKPGFQQYLDKLSSEKPPRYSRAVLETLAIIAYRQPVTRGDIEDIRGVQVSPHILKTLQDRGWIDEIGHKEVVGRPALFATTRHFLDDLNLRSLEELPPLHELQATLDMTQAGAALTAWETPSLPGVAQSHESQESTSESAAHSAEDHATDTEPASSELNETPASAGEEADAGTEGDAPSSGNTEETHPDAEHKSPPDAPNPEGSPS